MHPLVDGNDELADVVLQGRPLVSEDPSTWRISPTLAASGDLMGWWQDLIDRDNAAAAALSQESLKALRRLQREYEQATHRIVDIQGRRTVRTILIEILSYGLTTEQTAVLCGTSQWSIVRELVTQREMTTEEIIRRIDAERLLRDGGGPTEVARRCDMTIDQARAWASTLCVKSPKRGRFGAAKPAEIRERAMALYDTGMRGKQIVETLQAEMGEAAAGLTLQLVGQWATRSGRTRRAA